MQTVRRPSFEMRNSEETGFPIAHAIIRVDDELVLRRPRRETVPISYALIDHNREFIGQTLPWVKDYGLPKALENFRRDSLDVTRGLLAPYDMYAEGRIVGAANLHSREGARMKLGYWLAEEEQKKGYARKAAIVLVEYAFQKLGVETIDLRIREGNQGSEGVANFLGAQLTRGVELSPYNQELRIWEIHNGRK